MLVFGVVTCSFGRVQTIILCRTIGVSALFLLVWLNKYRGTWYMIVPLYLFRTGIMNCTYPLEESIIMDYVPKVFPSLPCVNPTQLTS